MGKIYCYFIFIFLFCFVRVSAQTYNWSLSHGGSNALGTPDEIIDVATDANGNTFVVASFGAAMTITGGTPANATNSGQQDVFIAKYNSSGVIQWYKRLGAAQFDKGVSIIANPSGAGEVYVTGIIQANQYFHLSSSPFIYLPAANPSTRASEMFVARYNSTSGNCEWVRGIGADGGTDAPAALEFDNLGNICVAGYIGASANIYDQRTGAGAPVTLAGSSPLPFNGVFDITIVKLTTAGAFVSSQVIGGTGADQPTAMHFDASGNMYLAGVFSGTLNLNPLGTAFNVVESAPQGSGDAFFAKYNSSGILLWGGTLRGANQEFIRSIGIDGTGNVYVSGGFSGFENFDLFGGTQTLTATGTMDIFIASYNATDGSFNYVNKIGSAAGNSSANSLSVLSSGDYYLSGYFSGTGVDFDPSAGTTSLSSAGNKDAFLAKYTSSGANTWAVKIGGANDDVANSVALTSDSKIVWGGSFNGSGIDVDPGVGTTTLTHVANEDMFLISYGECVGAAITTQPTASQSICTGQNASFTVVASGTGLTYQWKKGGVNLTDGGTISGATTATLIITGLTSGDAATYTVDVIGCTGTVTSNNAVLTVPSGASITGQPVATQTLCAGAAASMTVTATGSGLTYQWKKGGVNVTNGGTISGATSATLNISSLVSGDAATYTVDVTATGCGAPLTSSNSVLVVNTAPAITAQPVTTQTLCAGSAATFSVTATGTGLTYQWKKGGVDVTDGGTISGATTATLNISSIVSGDAGNYTVVVTGTCGSPVTSSASALVVNTGVAITVQPAATQTLCTGNAAAFSVTATGTGLTYQWKKGGVDVTNGGTISGALTNSLAISSLVSGDAATYTVVVSGTCGTPVTSSNAVLTVNTGAAITVQPVATQSLCAGAAASMTVTATGSSLTYQWKKGGVNVTDGGTVSGATTATLSISSLAAGDAGNYTVDVTASGCGSAVTSSTSVLAVNAAPAITAQPAATQTLCTGNAAAFSVTATGAGLTYQWKKGGVDVTNGGTISGALTNSLAISSLVSGDAATYTVVVSGTCGTPVTSSNAVLTVNTGAAITVQPVASQSLCAGAAASMTVTATGSSLTYQWKKGGVNVTDGGTVSGATTATLSISSLAAGDAGNYTVDVTASGCGSAVTSATSVLAVNAAPAITAQPAATQTLCTGNAAAFSVTATGAGLTYQWKKGGVDVTNGGTVSGALTNSLAISSLVSGDAATYTVVVSGTCGTPVTSSNAVLTVNTGAAITVQPVALQSLCAGAAASMTVTATGSSLTYQWKKGGVNVTDGGTVSGATTATLSISSLVTGDAGNYTVDVTSSGCGSPVTSSTSVLAVNTATAITVQPVATQTFCTGNAAAFSVTATGAGLTYQWKKGGVDVTDGGSISGATTSNLAISSLVSGDAGNYTVVVTGTCGSPVTSSASALTVNSGASISTQPIAVQTLCVGDLAVFSVTASGTGLTYQWQKNGSNVTNGGGTLGATTATLSISSVIASQAGDYTVNITASGCGSPVTSAVSQLIVNSPVNITTQPAAAPTLCTGNAATFTVVATGSSLTYQWKKNGVDIVDGGTVSGAGSSVLNISSLVSGDAGTYTVEITGVCGSPVTSSSSVLTVNTGPSITMQPVSSQTLCTGNPASFTVAVTGSGLSYQWQLNGVDISNGGTVSGATSSTLTISSLASGDAGNYTVNVSASGCGAPLVSSPSALTINNSINITAQPVASQTLCTGNAASFSITASGTGITYQWQKDGVDLVDGGTISGATTSNLAISSLVSGDAGTYTVHMTGACAPLTSASSVLTVNTGASITTQPVANQTLCAGTAASFSVSASGSGLTYQWQLDGVDLTDGGTISGATTATLNISALASMDAGDYTVNVSATGCGTPLTSTVSALIVNIPVNITIQPVSTQTLCTGNAAAFTVSATGSGLTYQWQKDGVDLADGGTISGVTAATLNISSLVSGDAGVYTVDITGACGPVTSSNSTLVVNTGASITTQPVATQTLCAGAAASFAVSASGSGLTYQWQLDGVDVTDGGSISGATTATLNISAVASSDAGDYTVNVSATGCGAPLTSTVSSLNVNIPVNITTQPVTTQTLCTGNAAAFTVSATGSGLTYQWQKDGVDLADGGTVSGATTSALDISSLVSGDAGVYTVDITGVCGSPVTSSNSNLVVNTGASITTQPVATQTLCAGAAASFAVSASGSGLTYQWQLDGVDVMDGGTISGATTASLDISAVASADAGDYTVNVSATGCGTPLTSTVSTLIVNTPVNVTAQPVAAQTLCTGNAASFNVVASGTGLTYQWQKDGVDLVDGATISGATTSTLDISSLVTGDAGSYTVDITGVCGSPVTSSVSTLTVNVGASITTQPVATQTVCTGNPVSFSVSATGSSLSYQWKLGGVNLVDGGTVSGANASTLNISSVAAGDAGDFTVDVSAAGCGVPLTSTISTLVVNNSIAINNQPVASQNLCSGVPAAFSVVASGTGITYQWQKDGVDLVDGGAISGATTATLNISSVTVADAGNYTLDITGTCGAVTSTTSVLSVTASVAITMQPLNVNACAGQTTNFDMTATGPSLTYQWRKNGVNLTDGGNISGANTSSLVFLNVSTADADVYDVVVSSSCGTPVTSNTVTLTVGAGVTITKQPISSVICLGQSASFTIQAPGATSFQWQFKPAAGSYADLANGSGISGVTTSTLIITGTQFDDRGNYRCVVTGGSCSGGVLSAAASLSFQSPSIASQPLSQSVCAGQNVTFGVVALGNNLTYQWVKNGTNVANGGRISGAQSATLKIINADATDEATYYCQVTGLCPPPTYSDNVDLSLSTCTGIEDAIEGNLFNIYPNPSTGIYHLDMDMYAAGTLTYEVFNALGESITQDEIHGEGKVVSVIDLTTQVAGVYIVRLSYDDKHAWIRLILEK